MKLQCRDCGRSFCFTEGERKFFAEKEWKDPVRCPLCREQSKRVRAEVQLGWGAVMCYWGFRRYRRTKVRYTPCS